MPNACESARVLSRSGKLQSFEPRKIQAVVVDSLSGYLEILEHLQKFEDLLEVVGRATNTADAVGLAASLDPDLIIMDAGVPLGNAVVLAGVLRECLPDTVIVLTSAIDTNRQRTRCLTGGAHAYICKQKLEDELSTLLVSKFPDVFEVGSLDENGTEQAAALDA